jgi:cobalt-zinc-cadmium efflux system outer membrane protein
MGLWGADRKWTAIDRLADPADREPELLAMERTALDRSIDLALARRRFTAAAKRANLARAEGWIPDVSAGVSAERDESEWGIGPAVELEVPLFYQGQGEVARARAEMRREERTLAGTAVRIRSAVRATLARVTSLRERAEFYRTTLMPLRERIVRQTELQYNAMNTGVFQLLAAKRDQVETARAWVEALRDYWIARAELDQLLAGRLVPMTTSAADSSAPAAGSRNDDH